MTPAIPTSPRARLLDELEDMDWPELPDLIDAIEAEAVAAERARLRAAIANMAGMDLFQTCGGWGCGDERTNDYEAVLALLEEQP